MFTFVAFLLTMLGCINWLMVGLLQYDFVAGIFGWQSSMMSRLVYIAFGIGAIYLSIRVIANKGSVKAWERSKKKSTNEAENPEAEKKPKKPKKNWKFWKKEPKVEVVKPEKVEISTNSSPDEPFSEVEAVKVDSLFDEHMGES